MKRFFWLGIYKEMERFCRTCPVCQKFLQILPKRAPLMPKPIIEWPFNRIAMDMTGPFPNSGSGYHYILVVIDYVTRLQKAVPLRSVTAPKTATKLMKRVARVGIPKDIVIDQGTNFTLVYCKAFVRCFLLDTYKLRFTIRKLMGW